MSPKTSTSTELIDRVRERGVKGCKPSAALEEDGLTIAVLGEDPVAVLCRTAAVQWWRWPVAVLPVAGSTPSVIG